MARYRVSHLNRLTNEAKSRFVELMRTIDTNRRRDDSNYDVDGLRVRLAVDDFKAILAEIRKLK